MNTRIIKIDKNNPESDKLAYAAEVLKNGGLVVFPTETVYGLGANALDAKAVSGIFEAKGRPSDNPLIIHISDKVMMESLASSRPEKMEILMDKFWPGPLTLVVPRSRIVLDIVTAGLDSVAIRMPSHPVALSLISMAGVPVAAPSANTSGRPSPTCAEHVIEDLSGKVDVIIDSGDVEVGLESTVLDITSDIPTILRPGGITCEQLTSFLGEIDICASLKSNEVRNVQKSNIIHPAPKSPGMKYKHYAPDAQIIIFEGKLEYAVAEINKVYTRNTNEGIKTGILATDETIDLYNSSDIISMGSRKDPSTIASKLFHCLRQFNGRDIKVILSESIEDEGIGFAVMNRLIKAAGYNIKKVENR